MEVVNRDVRQAGKHRMVSDKKKVQMSPTASIDTLYLH